jgi:GAF domain
MAPDPDAAADDRAAHERDRLVSLRKFDVFDTAPERAFDDLATLAAQVCAAPMAMVCFVGDDRQAFKARVGTSLEGTGRDISFCAHAIEQRDVFVIPDASADPRFATNPLVTDDPGIRFYAGAPVVTDDGHALGTVCVADRVARDLTAGQREALRALARQAMNQLELRLARHEDVPAQRRAEVLLRAITEGTATVTGSAFFSSLVRQLASALQVRRVFVAECLENDRARSRAVWLDNEPQPNFEYNLTTHRA